MLASFFLALREGLEAALIIAIVLGALRQIDRRDCSRLVWRGAATAGALSVVVAVLLQWLDWSLEGPAEEIFEGSLLLIAAALLTWMIFWVGRQSRHLRDALHAGVGNAVTSPGARGVFALTFVAVFREGVELALFLTAAAFDTSGTRTVAGTLLGLLGAGLLGTLVFSSTTSLSPRRFFQATSVLLAFFAAGLLAKGVHEFNEAGWIAIGDTPIWNTRAWLSDESPLGSLLGSLFGYTSTPTWGMVFAYVAYFGVIVWWLGFAAPARTGAATRIARSRAA